MTAAFWGKILLVDLSTGKFTVEAPGETVYRAFPGGTGLAAHFIHELQPAGADPLGESNVLAFVPGLLCATGAPMASRCSLAGKSPITGTWGDSNVGGYLGSAIKKAGYDGVFIRGISPHPVYLLVTPDRVELRPADHLWGKLTLQTQQAIKDEVGSKDLAVATIGPSGEQRSLAACIIHDQGRAAGRSGLGAVMGAKRLKAVAFGGDKIPPVGDPEKLKALCKKLNKSLTPHAGWMVEGVVPRMIPHFGRVFGTRMLKMQPDALMVDLFHRYGTSMGLSLLVELGDAPVKNWNGTAKDFPLDRSSRISDRRVVRNSRREYGCVDCPVRCGALVEANWSPGPRRRPEYESLAAFGPLLLNDDIDCIQRAYDQCNAYGIDSVEVGSSIALVMEAFEDGSLTMADTDSLTLNWGDPASIVKLVDLICARQGFGAVLADGVARAAAQLKLEKLAMHVHGQALGMHHPLYSPGLAATYVVDPTPARPGSGNAMHAEVMDKKLPLDGADLPQVGRFDYEGKGKVLAGWNHYTQVLNCLGLCLFSINVAELPVVELLNSATGWNCTSRELLTTGERVQTLRQMFNLREGLRPAHFQLPERLKYQLDPKVDPEKLRAEYFKAMGWDPASGKPSAERLKELGISEG